jgi:tRNA A58 N-methylase Trm61
MSRVCPSWLSFILYNPMRLWFTNREKILYESHITPESVVLEVGAGTGFLTEVIAQRANKVICVELQEDMVKKLRKRVGRFGNRIEIITADIALYPFETAYADVCILYYSFHEVHNTADAVGNISSAIREGGKLTIYEPTVEVGKKKMKRTIALFEAAGFEKEEEHNNMFTRFARLRKTG